MNRVHYSHGIGVGSSTFSVSSYHYIQTKTPLHFQSPEGTCCNVYRLIFTPMQIYYLSKPMTEFWFKYPFHLKAICTSPCLILMSSFWEQFSCPLPNMGFKYRYTTQHTLSFSFLLNQNFLWVFSSTRYFNVSYSPFLITKSLCRKWFNFQR